MKYLVEVKMSSLEFSKIGNEEVYSSDSYVNYGIVKTYMASDLNKIEVQLRKELYKDTVIRRDLGDNILLIQELQLCDGRYRRIIKNIEISELKQVKLPDILK